MKLAIGTAQFGLPYGIANSSGQVSRFQAAKILQMARLNGIDTIDTAIGYGDSEVCLGEAGVNDFRVVTKLPIIPSKCGDLYRWVRCQVVKSTLRLKKAPLYGLLVHRSDQLLSPHGKALYQTMLRLKTEGLVNKIGVSIYSPNELDHLIPQFKFDIVQAPFSLVDQRLITSGWLGRLNDAGITVHTRSAFLQGLLLMPESSIPLKFSPWKHIWGSWHQWLCERGYNALDASLSFPLSFPEIERVIVGADNIEQVEQLIHTALSTQSFFYPDIQSEDERLINPVNWGSM